MISYLTQLAYGISEDKMSSFQLIISSLVQKMQPFWLWISVKNFENTLNCDGKQNEKEGVPKTPKDILCYWLNSIYGLASAKGLKPNLALVLTHKDEIPSKDTKPYIQQYKSNILKVTEGKPYSSLLSMENIYVVDNKYGEESDFGILRSDIFKMITTQKSWGMERPLRWLKLEADILEKAEDESLRYLHVSEIDHLASRYQMKDAEIKSFLQFHHTFGVNGPIT